MSRTVSRSNPRIEAPPEQSRGAAASAGLHYVADGRPGIRREMGALGFRYMRADGRPVRNPADLKRIRALAIPPAWKDVWICPDPKGHLQATGRDARGRKQYRYHPQWRAHRDGNKFDRLEQFAAILPRLRARVAADLGKPGLPREKVLATVVQLLEKSLIRVGNDEYAKANRSFGLTTLRDQHVAVKGSTLRFEFRGKSGKRHTVDINDRRLARTVRQCRDLPGQELFQYLDDNGRRKDVNSADVNTYLREITEADFTAKDFRTWSGTVLAVTALRDREARVARAASMAAAKKNVVRAVEAVAGVLGNTPAVCRKSYIHPAVLECYMDRSMEDKLARGMPASVRKVASKLRADEVAALRILHCARSTAHHTRAA
jgi:DNA topoisomerase-1